MAIDIRSATADDIPGVWACFAAVARERKYLIFTEARPLEESRGYYQALFDNRAPFEIADDAGRIVGWCDVVPKPQPILEHSGVLGMGLLPEYRGRGIGRQLLTATIDSARRRGLERIELSVFNSNARARRLYESVGFVAEGARRRFRKLDGVFEDDTMMALLLNP